MLPDGQRWDGLTECVPEIGVLGAATVTRPPGGVDAELHQVREPAKLICARRRTAWKSTELVQIDLLSALGGQVFVDEHFVRQFVFGIVMNVLRHVAVQRQKVLHVQRISSCGLRGIARN